MTRLDFEYWQRGAIYWARYVTEAQMRVQEHWVGLTDIEQLEVIDFARWSRFAVNNNNCEEVAVYLRIAWALLRSKQALGNAFYCG